MPATLRQPVIRALGICWLIAVTCPAAEVTPGADQGEIPRDQLIAGVRAYPAGVLRALLTISESPLVVRQLAEEPEGLFSPEKIYPPIPAELQTALEPLKQVPEAVALAATFPDGMARLRRLYADEPEAVEREIAELRERYEAVGLEAAWFWERLLREHPGALDAYAELVTRFCQEQRSQYPEFPCVRVTRREYYYACPPDQIVKAFADQANAAPVLADVMRKWWQRYSPEAVDGTVLSGKRLRVPEFGSFLASLPPEQRAGMWSGEDAGAGQGDLVPIILQPPADQPAEARLAYAVAEHARLWGSPQQAREPSGLESGEPDRYVGPQEPIEQPGGPVPWTEVLREEWSAAPEVNVRRYVTYVTDDEPVYVESEPVTALAVEVGVGRTYRYYCGYPWALPLVQVWRSPGPFLCGGRIGYGRHLEICYHGERARIGLRIGGRRLYYECRLPRVVRSRVGQWDRDEHHRRFWRNYGAPYGGPYWVNYGHSYPGHPGLADYERRISSGGWHDGLIQRGGLQFGPRRTQSRWPSDRPPVERDRIERRSQGGRRSDARQVDRGEQVRPDGRVGDSRRGGQADGGTVRERSQPRIREQNSLRSTAPLPWLDGGGLGATQVRRGVEPQRVSRPQRLPTLPWTVWRPRGDDGPAG
jgi:hypothetical protein